jgi:hypothetical protein
LYPRQTNEERAARGPDSQKLTLRYNWLTISVRRFGAVVRLDGFDVPRDVGAREEFAQFSEEGPLILLALRSSQGAANAKCLEFVARFTGDAQSPECYSCAATYERCDLPRRA